MFAWMCRITRCEHRITRCSQSICIHELICLILQDANTVSQDAYTTVSTCMYVNDIQPIHTYTLSMPIHTHTLSSSYDFQNDKSTVLVPNKSQDLNFGGLQKKKSYAHTHTHTHTQNTRSPRLQLVKNTRSHSICWCVCGRARQACVYVCV